MALLQMYMVSKCSIHREAIILKLNFHLISSATSLYQLFFTFTFQALKKMENLAIRALQKISSVRLQLAVLRVPKSKSAELHNQILYECVSISGWSQHHHRKWKYGFIFPGRILNLMLIILGFNRFLSPLEEHSVSRQSDQNSQHRHGECHSKNVTVQTKKPNCFEVQAALTS